MCKTLLFYQLIIKLFHIRQNRFLFLECKCLIGGRGTLVLKEEQFPFERQYNNKPQWSSFLALESPCGRIEGALLGHLVLVLAVWSLDSHFSFLTFNVLRSTLIQQPFIESTVRIFFEPTIMLGTGSWWIRLGPTLKRRQVLQWRQTL